MSRFYPLYIGQYDPALTEALGRELGLSPLTARALIRRGVDSVEAGERFLHPSLEDLLDPFLLPDMAEAVERIRRAVARQEWICVYGDYDADGVCATAILLSSIRAMGGRAVPYIPSRHGEGYGLNPEAVQKLARRYIKLIITVDNGIAAFDEIALCRNLGVDVVVTDHHSAGLTVPSCCAVVAASRKDSTYPNPNLCGAGAAFKLSCALRPEADHGGELALAAVATVADIVPLTGENRAIVALGLPHVPGVTGLSALLDAAGFAQKELTAQALAFTIAPRLNAAGRISDAMLASELLVTDDPVRAKELAALLDENNTARKTIEGEIFNQALAAVNPAERGIIASSDSWNPGVIGIVASRLCERFHRPAILFSEKDGVLTGSGRCPAGIDLYAVLTGLSRWFVRYGGHARAAGVTILPENFQRFREGFLAAMDACDPSCFAPAYGFEERVKLSELSVTVVQELSLLAPFGQGNPEPAYLLEQGRLKNVSRMGKEGIHLSAFVEADGAGMRLVAFRAGERMEEFRRGAPLDLLVRPGVNRFRGNAAVELYLEAGETGETYEKLFRAILAELMYNGSCSDATLVAWAQFVCPLLPEKLARPAMEQAYRLWRQDLSGGPLAAESCVANYSPAMLTALVVFLQLGFMTLGREGNLVWQGEAPQAELTDSSLFCLMQKES